MAASAWVFGGVIERFGYRTAFVGAAACVGVGAALLGAAPREEVRDPTDAAAGVGDERLDPLSSSVSSRARPLGQAGSTGSRPAAGP